MSEDCDLWLRRVRLDRLSFICEGDLLRSWLWPHFPRVNFRGLPSFLWRCSLKINVINSVSTYVLSGKFTYLYAEWINWWIYWLCLSIKDTFIFPFLINWQLKQLLLIGAVYHMFNSFLQFSYLILINLCTLWESSLVYLWVTLSILCIYKFCVKLSASSFGWQ